MTEGSGPQYPMALLDLTAEQCRAFGEAYLRDTLDYWRERVRARQLA